jgi:hypothetical protein
MVVPCIFLAVAPSLAILKATCGLRGKKFWLVLVERNSSDFPVPNIDLAQGIVGLPAGLGAPFDYPGKS